jgi:uncharacterized protein (TIGR00251 family)
VPDGQLRAREHGSAIEVDLHVQPRARRVELAGLHDGALKLRVTAPPVDQAANRAVINYFADALHIPKSRLSIVAGGKSRTKTLRIEGVQLREFLDCISGALT